MNKFQKILLTLVSTTLVTTAGALATGCGPKNASIEFETGYSYTVDNIKDKIGTTVTLPTLADRTDEGKLFEGWYYDEACTQPAQGEIELTENVKLFAKWKQLPAITLDADGGTLAKTTLYLAQGENVSAFLANVTPTKPGLQFAGWYINGNALTTNATMQSTGMTLKAKYKVNYTITVYEQKADLTGYEQVDPIIGSDFVGLNNYELDESACEKTGFEIDRDHAGSVLSLNTLSATANDNQFVVYLKRSTYHVAFRPNLPADVAADMDPIEQDYTYGNGELKAPEKLTVNGYYFAGWSSNYEGAPEYQPGDTLNVTQNSNFYAIWIKGLVDLGGSGDVAFLIPQADGSKKLIINRGGYEFECKYIASNQTFQYENDDEILIVVGKVLTESGAFMYENTNRIGTYYLATSLTGDKDNHVTLKTDAYNGITYTVMDDEGEETTSTGYYQYDASAGCNQMIFTAGDLKGKSMYFRLYNGGLFMFRNEDEVKLGYILQMTAPSNEEGAVTSTIDGATYGPSNYIWVLDGFMTATRITMGSTSTSTSYYQTVKDENGNITAIQFLNNQGAVSSEARYLGSSGLTLTGGISLNAMVMYNAQLDTTFTVGDDTIKLDGTFNATFNGTTKATYSIATNFASTFNIFIFTFEDGTTAEYKYVVVDADTRTYGLVKLENYTELTVFTNAGQSSSLKVTFGENGENSATIYAMTRTMFGSSWREYFKGTYTIDADGYYVIAGNYASNGYLNEFTLLVDMDSLGAPICGFIGSKNPDDALTQLRAVLTITVYTQGDAQLLLIGGSIAAYVDGDDYIVGMYTLQDNYLNFMYLDEETGKTVTTIYLVDKDELSLTKTEMIFLPEAYQDAKQEVTITYTGYQVTEGEGDQQRTKLCATYKQGETTIDGFVTGVRYTNSDGSYYIIYTFVAADGDFTAYYMMAEDNNGNPYLVMRDQMAEVTWSAMEDAEFMGFELGEVTFDGFGSGAIAVTAGATSGYLNIRYFTEGTDPYVHPDFDGMIAIYIITSSNNYGPYYLDYKTVGDATTYAIRGTENGGYLEFNNRKQGDRIVQLDGYGKATVTVYHENEENDVYTGTYTIAKDGLVTVTYKVGDNFVNMNGALSTMEINGTTYNTFVIAVDAVAGYYGNARTMEVLVLDNVGGATRYNKLGATETGDYVVISDTMLYFVNESADDATIYYYDKENATFVKADYTYIRGLFISEDFRTFNLFEYGVASIAGDNTRYYYDFVNGKVCLYYYDANNTNANVYGYVKVEVALSGDDDDTIVYKGVTYHYNSALNIVLTGADAKLIFTYNEDQNTFNAGTYVPVNNGVEDTDNSVPMTIYSQTNDEGELEFYCRKAVKSVATNNDGSTVIVNMGETIFQPIVISNFNATEGTGAFVDDSTRDAQYQVQAIGYDFYKMLAEAGASSAQAIELAQQYNYMTLFTKDVPSTELDMTRYAGMNFNARLAYLGGLSDRSTITLSGKLPEPDYMVSKYNVHYTIKFTMNEVDYQLGFSLALMSGSSQYYLIFDIDYFDIVVEKTEANTMQIGETNYSFLVLNSKLGGQDLFLYDGETLIHNAGILFLDDDQTKLAYLTYEKEGDRNVPYYYLIDVIYDEQTEDMTFTSIVKTQYHVANSYNSNVVDTTCEAGFFVDATTGDIVYMSAIKYKGTAIEEWTANADGSYTFTLNNKTYKMTVVYHEAVEADPENSVEAKAAYYELVFTEVVPE